jgi:hypothetical protein
MKKNNFFLFSRFSLKIVSNLSFSVTYNLCLIEFIFLGNIQSMSLCLITFSPRLLFFEGRLYSEKFLYWGETHVLFSLVSHSYQLRL